jgi:hypothetical protein
MMLKTLEGTRRYLITRRTTAEADLYEAIPREFKETITEVHFANGEDPELLGQQGTYGIDLDEEWLARIRGEGGFQRPSNLIDVVEVDPGRLGENVEHTTSEVIEPLAPFLEDVPELPPLGAAALAENPDEAPRNHRYYSSGPVLDQGSEGACTGFCGANFLNGAPLKTAPAKTNEDALQFYHRNRKIDEWPGEDYSGSSVSAMCKQLMELGHIEQAAVTNSFEEMARWKLYEGGLMISTPWYEGMYRTDDNGYIRPTGLRVGAHAIWDRAITAWRAAVWFNSWGEGFGFKGNGYVAEDDIKWLIQKGLRAYTAVQVS